MSVTNRYFLAANGFSGFRSGFGTVLSSEKIKRLYIIKGGSGVGKSTLMRRISSHFADTGYAVEEILCSSDPASLDGVVIKSGGGDILLIDGTSPHEYDMKYPAVRDFTVDLSKHIDEEAIECEKEKVIFLIKQKKKHYDFAYKNLHLAGIAYETIMDIAKPYAKLHDISKLAKKLFPNRYESCAEIKHALYSAFCRVGLVSLDTNDKIFERTYYFEQGYKTQILFSMLISEIKTRSLTITVFPSPLSEDIIDGFSVDGKTLFKACEGAATYKAECYFNTFDDCEDKMIRSLYEIYNTALTAAEEAMKGAFENHTALEEIYGAHMNFEKNTHLSDELIEKIRSEL